MNFKKPQKTFAAVTMLTVVSVALVLVVYAITIGTITGGNVTIEPGGTSVQGTMNYSLDNATGWAPTLTVSSAANSWYARFTVTAGGYAGPVTISWQLQRSTDAGANWFDVGSAVSQSFTLDGTLQTIYTSGTSATSNHDWSAEVADIAGLYRVEATITNV